LVSTWKITRFSSSRCSASHAGLLNIDSNDWADKKNGTRANKAVVRILVFIA
jgi:hypothetical protein